MAIASSIISLAHGLNFSVIAEGVETEEQQKLLRLLRCDEMQGFLYSRPLPDDKIETLLASELALTRTLSPAGIGADQPLPATQLPERRLRS
jgi:EAL domain-containing protein (putative c-di-GMP-specific phosphodiesterase class I)